MYTYLIIGITYALAAVVQPGPFQGYLIAQSLKKGWKKTLPASFAPLISDGPIILLVVIILSQVPSGFICIIQLAGGIFLLYISFVTLRKWKINKSGEQEQDKSGRRTLIQATFVNLLNPAPYLGWSLIMGPILIKGWREDPANGITLLASFYGSMILLSMGLIILFASAKKTGPHVTRALLGISAVALGCFGLYQLYNGIFYLVGNFK